MTTKCQNNSKKFKECEWHRISHALSFLCKDLNRRIEEFEEKDLKNPFKWD